MNSTVVDNFSVINNIMQQAPVAMGILSGNDLIIKSANKLLLEVWGKSDNVIGLPLIEGLPEIKGQGFIELLNEVINTKKPYHGYETAVKLFRNNVLETCYFNFVYSPIVNESGATDAMVVANEITEQVNAKTKIEESEAKFKNLILQAPTAKALYVGRELKVEVANDALIKIWGKDKSVIGKPLAEAVPELEGQPFLKILDDVFTSGIEYKTSEARADFIINGVLTPAYFNFTYKPLFDEHGKVYAIINVAVDITESVLYRRKFEEEEERKNFALRSVGLGTWNFNITNSIVSWDERSRELYGFSKGESIAYEDAMNTTHEDDKQRVMDAIDAALKGVNDGDYNIEFRTIGNEDKKLRWVRSKGKAYFNSDGNPYRFAGTLADITEEKRINAALQNVEARFQTALNNASLGIVTSDMQGNYVLINKAFADMLGYELEELYNYNSSYKNITYHEDIPQTVEWLQDLLKGNKKAINGNKRYVRKDGSVFWANINVTPIFDEHGKPESLVSISKDITDEMNATLEQQKLITLVDNSVDLMSIMELDGTNSYINQAGMDMLGFESKQEVLNTPIKNLHTDKDYNYVAENVLPVVMQNGYWSGQMYVQHLKTKERFPVYNYCIRIDDPITGKPLSVGAVMRDLRPELNARKTLIESEERFRQLADFMPQFVWTGDAEGNLNYFNETVYTYSGLSKEEIAKDGWLQIVHPDDREENIQKWTHAITTGEEFFYEHRFKRHDGVYLWQLSRAVPHRDANGKIVLWIGTSTNIQEQKSFAIEMEKNVAERTADLKEINADLERVNKNLQEFAYVASHDLQEPLRKINIYASLLAELLDGNTSENQNKYLNKITESATRMSTLIKDLLNFSRLAGGQNTRSKVNLNHTLQFVLKDFEVLILQKEANVIVDELCIIEAEALQMQQLFYNLINNALKFTVPGVKPVISISASVIPESEVKKLKGLKRDKTYCRISIADNGIGFNQQFAEQIFVIFQRLHTRNDYSGTGIGLALCQKIVAAHNGIIYANSIENQGATFHIVLPVNH